MSSAMPLGRPRRQSSGGTGTMRLALLGTGTVGSAFVARHQSLRARRVALPELAWLANSRAARSCGNAPADVLAQINAAAQGEPGGLQPWAETEGLRAGDVLVDATASDAVANWHAEWLARGVHVVTANKLGRGAQLARAQAIDDARHAGNAAYGDSATVGAGLPLLSSLRALVAGGDHVHAVEGVLSGSMAWLFHHYDGTRPFSDWVRQARAAGYTEPDPRIDLSGEDVRRKLLILARSAGFALCRERVALAPLLPASLAAASADTLDADLSQLDVPLRERFERALAAGERLCFVGRFDADGASVGLRSLPVGHPLLGGCGTDNRVAIRSDRYREQPLLIQGPGAGAEVTAAALLDDVLRIAAG